MSLNTEPPRSTEDLSINPHSPTPSTRGRDVEKPATDAPASTSNDAASLEAQSLAGNQPRIAPDGGLHAWLKVFGGFLVYINIWGFCLTYGAFQSYYTSTLLPDSSPSAISWIGTVQAWLLIVVGVLSGPLFDLGYFRPMLYVGNFLVVFGIMMLSLCTTYWQVFLAQGVCMGLGAGLLYIPSLALVGIWFDKRRAMAMGTVMSGIAVGGVIYLALFDKLLPTIGFPQTVRAMGFIALGCALLSFPALLSGHTTALHLAPHNPNRAHQPPKPKPKPRPLFDRTALHDPLFLLFTACIFTNFLGYIVPYFYIPTYAAQALGATESTALYMLIGALAASFFGRIASGVVAHWAGSIVTWGVCAAGSGVLALCWARIVTVGGFVVFSVLWGFLSAALVTLPSAAFASICPDLSRLGTRIGMSWAVSSIASLIGSPIAGSLLRTKDGETDFLGVQLWSGICLLVGSGWLFVLWMVTRKSLGKGWWI